MKQETLLNRRVATTVAQLINNLCGEEEYSGDSPYMLQAIDLTEATAYKLEIRKGSETFGKSTRWITILEELIDNPHVVHTYHLTKLGIGRFWRYDDVYLMKYGESSLHKLQIIQGRLERAAYTLAPNVVQDNSISFS